MTPPQRTHSDIARSDEGAENKHDAAKRQDLSNDDTIPQATPNASPQNKDVEDSKVIKTKPGTTSTGLGRLNATRLAPLPQTDFVPLAGNVQPPQSSLQNQESAAGAQPISRQAPSQQVSHLPLELTGGVLTPRRASADPTPPTSIFIVKIQYYNHGESEKFHGFIHATYRTYDAAVTALRYGLRRADLARRTTTVVHHRTTNAPFSWPPDIVSNTILIRGELDEEKQRIQAIITEAPLVG